MVERARAKWEDAPKYLAHVRPAPQAHRRSQRGQGSATGRNHRAGGGSGTTADAETVLRGGRGAGVRDTGGEDGIRRSPPARPCMWPFLRFRPLVLRAAYSDLEDMAEPQAVGQVQQRHDVPRAGAGTALPLAPHRLGMDSETTVQLRPRHARRLLEPL